MNSTGDAVDSTIGDGQCDTGGTNADGDPDCTLRAALAEADDPATPVDTIWFAIPATDPGHAAGVWTVAPASALPATSAVVTIDGSTQAGWAANTLAADAASPTGLDGTQVVVVDGSGAGATTGLVLGGDGSALRGLVVGGFADHGIEVTGDGITLVGLYVGTDVTGTAALANGADGIHVTGANAVIGGAVAADRVLVAGNGGDGIELAGAGAGGAVVTGSIIGHDATGAAALPNAGSGLVSDGATGVRIGGAPAAESNIVSGNGADGVAVTGAAAQATVLGNAMAGNGDLAVDLGADGVTLNDTGDGDPGPNDLLNAPALSTAVASGGVLTVDYGLDVPAGTYRVELFANPAGADPSGRGETGRLIGTDTLVHPGGGTVLATVAVPGGVGTVVTATATVDLGGGAHGVTSEASNAITSTDLAAVTVLDDSIRRSDVVAAGGLDPAAATTAGAAGTALALDGSDDRLVGPGLDVVDGALTVGAWVRPGTLSGVDRIVSKRTGGGGSDLRAGDRWGHRRGGGHPRGRRWGHRPGRGDRGRDLAPGPRHLGRGRAGPLRRRGRGRPDGRGGEPPHRYRHAGRGRQHRRGRRRVRRPDRPDRRGPPCGDRRPGGHRPDRRRRRGGAGQRRGPAERCGRPVDRVGRSDPLGRLRPAGPRDGGRVGSGLGRGHRHRRAGAGLPLLVVAQHRHRDRPGLRHPFRGRPDRRDGGGPDRADRLGAAAPLGGDRGGRRPGRRHPGHRGLGRGRDPDRPERRQPAAGRRGGGPRLDRPGRRPGLRLGRSAGRAAADRGAVVRRRSHRPQAGHPRAGGHPRPLDRQ